MTALRGIDLSIQPGERVAMLGPNGSGKSTLVHIISGLLLPDRGEVRLFGESDPKRVASQLGTVFQHPSLDPHMSVRENLRDHALLQGIVARDVPGRIRAVLRYIGLNDRSDHRVSTLSGGLVRRVDLARALLHDPKLLLLDEPTVGLDPSAREQFLSLIEEVSQDSITPATDGRTMLMSTHLIDEADRQDRVVLVHEGRIVADDTPTKLRQAVGARVLTVHDNSWRPPEIEHEHWRRAAGGWIRSFADVDSHAREMLGALADSNVPFSLAPPTLADVFEHHTGARLTVPDDGDATAHQQPAVAAR